LAGFFKWNARKPEEPSAEPALPAEPSASDTITTSKVFPRFLSVLAHHSAPVLIDLGPVVGSNVSFFGERFACKIHVEDLFSEIERHAKAGSRAVLSQLFATRFARPDESVDGILCWDLFDFLDPASGQVLASRLARLVRKGGALHGFFGTTPVDLQHYSRFAIEADDTLRVRAYPATPAKRTVLLTRDIGKMFSGLTVAESVLLKSNTREILFRRP
jgi:hypothetical protein